MTLMRTHRKNIIKQFIQERNELEINHEVIGNLPVIEYHNLFISLGYKEKGLDQVNGWMTDFTYYWEHDELPTLVLSGSLYYGNYKLIKDVKKTKTL